MNSLNQLIEADSFAAREWLNENYDSGLFKFGASQLARKLKETNSEESALWEASAEGEE